MKRYITPPIFSTSFSESGKSAKRRFENILNTKAKKTGVIAFVFVLAIIGIAGIMITYNAFSENEYALETDELLNTICSSPLTSSNPNDYIKEHQKEFNKIVAMDINALSYMFSEFEKKEIADGLRENIMMIACRQILGDEDIEYTAARGFHWYSTMKDYIINQGYLYGYDYVKEHNPKAYILLDISNGSKPASSKYYKQVMEHMANELIKAYSPYYEIVNQFPLNYEEKINGDDFEAVFLYKEIHKNYYKDPDTVGYIKEAKESGNKNYQKYYDEYNAEQESNYEFKVTAKILPDKSLDMSTFKLYTNISPKGTEWKQIKGFSEFIIDSEG